jgi:sodium/bile acid cotransporter 7
MSRLLGFLKKQFLPVGLVVVALVGFVFPAPGLYMDTLPTQYIAVTFIFLLSGLMLRTDEIRAALSAWSGTLWGSLSILVITPIIGVAIAFQLPIERHFQLGLALFCCMPTTISSGIALTNQARGNVALALLLTVLTNIAGVFTVPFVLAQLLGALGQVELSATQLLKDLCLSILLPLAVGQYLRRFVTEWVDRNRTHLTMLNSLALISIPWMKFSQSSAQLSQIALFSLLLLLVSGLGIHVLYLLLNNGVCRLLRLQLPARKAVVLLSSQKTLPVAMTVLAFLPESAVSPEAKGLIAIPCITFHLGQIFLDAIIATRWGRD